jgi:putative addiction module CopG family antidote
MPRITVDLPPELGEFVEMEVESGEFANANEYIMTLLETARRKRSEIEAALIKGLHSGPPKEWTRQEWNEMRNRVRERHQKD